MNSVEMKVVFIDGSQKIFENVVSMEIDDIGMIRLRIEGRTFYTLINNETIKYIDEVEKVALDNGKI